MEIGRLNPMLTQVVGDRFNYGWRAAEIDIDRAVAKVRFFKVEAPAGHRLARSRGNLSSTARLLGMTRPQLAYRLKKK